MTNAKRRRLWRDLVADYRASELPVREWCENHGVTRNQLHYWLGKIEDGLVAPEHSEPEGSTWARLEIVEDASAIDSRNGQLPDSVGSQVSVRVGSATIDVRSGFDANLFADVLRVVVAVSASMESAVNPDGRSPRC
ncbi:MAG: IS66 family insertion sequence element accessory protein TnpA [Armatimonadota bacterium]|jgi:hypothetical protein